MRDQQLIQAIACIKAGGIIAYPTEAVYGLGCDPLNQEAVMNLLRLKNRSVEKGLILIAADYGQLKPYIQELAAEKMTQVFSTWPGPTTWVFPASVLTPPWISGKFTTVAVRVTDHPLVKQLCEMYGGALVSTSANLEGCEPARDAKTIKTIFASLIPCIIDAPTGGNIRPSAIHDAVTGKIYRA